ncbi:hypothetical protein H6F93_00535 [Leptolyngbya sp. FACHB-671]|uniref:hypothetical protein n=1 Tax=Leptolyngbya sp. FACHB-671 TaxID=2692812 RepID=UPI001686CF3E|nr:hypothetical protein [Leptolyngbya sp. FACHB-671]MBD2066037.1 hypothetical protein [Leptolyngbya sp. FACHB-671]
MSIDVTETMHSNLDRLPATTGQAWLESFYAHPSSATEGLFDNLGRLYTAIFGLPTDLCTHQSCGLITFKYLKERYPTIGGEVPICPEEYGQGLINCGVPTTLAERAASIRFASPPYSKFDRLVIEQVRLMLGASES